jgi:hypothetical protein
MFLNSFSNLNLNCSTLLYLRNLQEQVKKVFCYQKIFWPFIAQTNCSSDLKTFANTRPSASNFKSFSRSLKQFFLTVDQNNFGNKIQLLNGTKPRNFGKTFPIVLCLNVVLLLPFLNLQAQTGSTFHFLIRIFSFL